MSSSTYSNRRFPSSDRTTPTTSSITSSITNSMTSSVEPSTYGTSWNSVRWNRAGPGYRSNTNHLAARFENKSKTSFSLSPSARATHFPSMSIAARHAANLASIGPSVSARASRFDSSVFKDKERYRSEAQELIKKYTSRERGQDTTSSTGKDDRDKEQRKRESGDTSYTSGIRRPQDIASTATPAPYSAKKNDFPYRKTPSLTPVRSTVPSLSRYSTFDRSSILSPSPTPPSLPHTLRCERPWRQRMAENQRIRATMGDDVSAAYSASRASRRGSLSQASGDEASTNYRTRPSLASSYKARQGSAETSITTSYTPSSRFTAGSGYSRASEQYRPSATFMSRSYSPIRSPIDLFNSVSMDTSLPAVAISECLEKKKSDESELSKSEDEAQKQKRGETVKPRREETKTTNNVRKASNERKKWSSKERTSRRNSRQSSMDVPHSSSSEEESKRQQSRDTSRQRRRRKKQENSRDKSEPALPPTPRTSEMTKSMSTSMVDSTASSIHSAIQSGIAELTSLVVALSEHAGDAVLREPPQSPLSPRAVQETPLSPHLSRSSSRKGVVKQQIIKSPSLVEVHGVSKSDSASKVTSTKTDASSIPEDSQHDAVAHFKKPVKTKVKPLAPVPGVWKEGRANDEYISKNKAFMREAAYANASKIVKVKRRETVTKRFKATPRKITSKIERYGEKEKNETESKSEKGREAEKTKEKVPEKQKKEEKKDLSGEPSKIKKLFLGKKKTLAKDASTETSESFSQESEQEKTAKTIGVPIREKVKNERRIIEKLPTATATLVEDLKKPIVKSMKAAKTVRQKTRDIAKARLRCRAFSCESLTVNEMYRRRPMAQKAQVIVDAPVEDVNIAKIRLKIRPFQQSLPSIIESTSTPVADHSPNPPEVRMRKIYEDHMKRSVSRDSTTKAAELLDEMRFTEPALEWKRDNDEEDQIHDGRLILPDQSILEDYVKRKRGRLDRQLRNSRSASICSSRGYESSNGGCESPANSTVSELHAPPSVRIATSPASQRGVPLITTPTRGDCSTPGSSHSQGTQSTMLDVSAFNNFNSTPQGFKPNPPQKIQMAKPIAFDAPKSPFEERLQQQANRIRKGSVSSTVSAHSDTETGQERPTAEGMSALSSAFTAALSHPRHEQRYAAHIPVNRNNSLEANTSHGVVPTQAQGSNSGRQSSTSVDSAHSGVLDAATKQLDAVIDEARHKHHQHRSKFKEAIDYLDQIFEDLKKECDVAAEDKNNNGASQDTRRTNSSIGGDEAAKRAAAAEAQRLFRQSGGQPSTSNSLPNRAQRHRQVQPPSPVELVVPIVKTSQPSMLTVNSPPLEPSVTETIVLPKRTDKYDFTRRWLQDDLSSLAHQPPANIAPDVSIYQDVDEHSLGSCSAEVAAICANKRERPQKKAQSNGLRGTKQPINKTSGHRQVQPQNPAPVRPQPFRPQPVYALPAGGQTNGSRHFPADLEPPPALPRVASFDNGHVSGQSSATRAISQEPYQTLGSARSEEPGYRPSPSAFHNVPSASFSSRGGLRGSLRSLPDAGLLVRSKTQGEDFKDPVLAIDQLVAELELNTEQMSISDKRRSFPTTFVRIQNEYEQPTKQRAELRQAPTRGRAHGYVQQQQQQHQPVQTQSQIYPQNNFPRVHRQEKSLDEVATMLNNVVSDFQASQPHQPGVVRKKSTSSQHAYPLNPQNSINNGLNPFETINHEKINPSRVEAMHNMFEKGTVPTSWKIQQGSQPASYKPNQPLHQSSQEENNYYEINEFAAKPYKRVSPPRQMHAVSVRRSPLQRQASFVQDYVPQVPTTNPPQHPPGSASSSQNGGYYSSNSSGVGVSSQSQQVIRGNEGVQRRGSFVGRQSISSHAPSVDDDDDGFYDNIGTFDERRFSRGSDLDTTSMTSMNRGGSVRHGTSRGIGSFLKRIGGGTNGRAPQSAASLMSLNKVAQEPMPTRPGVLMKSNSLSTEPWKTQVMNATRGLVEAQQSYHQYDHSHHDSHNGSQGGNQRNGSGQKGTGLGARLKNSLFGSKKRLN